MTAYNIVNAASLVAGQPEDVSQVLANFQAIQSILNGNVDGANLKNYPGDATQVLRGDMTWATLQTILFTVQPYANFTPVLTASGVNPTLGTGSVQNGRWVALGKLIHATGRIIFGAGGGAAAGNGSYAISLPHNWAAPVPDTLAGWVRLKDSSSGNILTTFARFSGGATTFVMLYPTVWPAGPEQPVTDAAPWVWAASDELHFNIVYESS